jgi:hypothetical protein
MKVTANGQEKGGDAIFIEANSTNVIWHGFSIGDVLRMIKKKNLTRVDIL